MTVVQELAVLALHDALQWAPTQVYYTIPTYPYIPRNRPNRLRTLPVGAELILERLSTTKPGYPGWLKFLTCTYNRARPVV